MRSTKVTAPMLSRRVEARRPRRRRRQHDRRRGGDGARHQGRELPGQERDRGGGAHDWLDHSRSTGGFPTTSRICAPVRGTRSCIRTRAASTAARSASSAPATSRGDDQARRRVRHARRRSGAGGSTDRTGRSAQRELHELGLTGRAADVDALAPSPAEVAARPTCLSDSPGARHRKPADWSTPGVLSRLNPARSSSTPRTRGDRSITISSSGRRSGNSRLRVAPRRFAATSRPTSTGEFADCHRPASPASTARTTSARSTSQAQEAIAAETVAHHP